MSARDDDNFRQMLRALPMRGATPRVVEFSAGDVVRVEEAIKRHRKGLPRTIRDRGVVGRIAALLRTE